MMDPFKDVINFIDCSRIKKALTDKHKCYRSHLERFWNIASYDEDSKKIVSALKIKDENKKDKDIEVKFKVEDVSRVLDLQGDDKDPIQFNKTELSRPYRFLVHSTIHALHHRKGGFDMSSDFVICVLRCLILNRSFNISHALFNHMVDNVHREKFPKYPRFIQMLLDDQIKNLPKADDDEVKLDHMDAEMLKRLNVYQGVECHTPTDAGNIEVR
ncbi:hypothetical protein Hanom_Chr02g00114531 [Helianthus anomalus]